MPDIKEYASTSPYLRAKFELMRDQRDDSIEVSAMMRTVGSGSASTQ